MLDNKVDQQKRLEAARAELAVVECALTKLVTTKVAASASSAAFAAWRQEHDTRTAERERLQILIEVIERDLAAAIAADRIEELRQRHAAKLVENAKLAERVRSDLAKANAIYIALIRDVARSAVEDQAISAELPEDLGPLISADQLARARPGLSREEISRERLVLWVQSSSGGLIGDQEAVEDLGNGFGRIARPLASMADTRCVRQLFEEAQFHPAEPAERARPLWEVVILQPDGPRTLFDGTEMRQPREVLAALDRAVAPREPRARPVETEIRPIEMVRPAS